MAEESIARGVAAGGFSAAVLRLLEDLNGRGRATQRDLAAIRRRVGRRIGRNDADVDEVVSRALAQFTSAVARGLVRPPPDGDPAGYLLRIADHVLADMGRSAKPHPEPLGSSPSTEADEGPEEAVLRDLARQSSSWVIRDLLRAARQAGDVLAVRVLVAYLDTAATADHISHRRVAATAGVSHPTVRAVLRRAATYLGTNEWPAPPQRK
jgi:DNA-directed RNA polymerase specialized sigma24 family protein